MFFDDMSPENFVDTSLTYQIEFLLVFILGILIE